MMYEYQYSPIHELFLFGIYVLHYKILATVGRRLAKFYAEMHYASQTFRLQDSFS